MAGFKMHMTTSTLLGVGYGVAGHYVLGAPLSTCLVAGGLCSVSGMLPDLDSDSGVPLRETATFAAAVVPMLMLDRFRHLGMDHEQMALAAGLIYVFIRFVVVEIFKRYTVHRGMWHSLPACAIAGLAAYLVCSCEDSRLRMFKAGGVMLGFLSHLVLDEFYSLEFKRGRFRIKRSFGTALKFFSKSGWANTSTYAKLAFMMMLAFGDDTMMERLQRMRRHLHQGAEHVVEHLHGDPHSHDRLGAKSTENRGAATAREQGGGERISNHGSLDSLRR